MTETIQADKDRYNREQRQLELLYSILPLGSADIDTAANWLDKSGIDYGKFGDWLEDLSGETCTPLIEMDIAEGVLEYIAQEACPELAEHIYGNYMCSAFNIDEEKAGELLYAVPEEKRGQAWEFLRDFIGAIEPKETND